MLCYVLYPVNAKVIWLMITFLCLKSNQVKVVISKKYGCGSQPMLNIGTIHLIIFHCNLFVLIYAKSKNPEVVFNTFANMLYLRIVIHLLSDKAFKTCTVTYHSMVLQLLNQEQQFHFVECSCANQDFNESKQFGTAKKFIHDKLVIFLLIVIS